ncbi:hypothetical protein Tco_0906220, partial [Tanacetum coccineum]
MVSTAKDPLTFDELMATLLTSPRICTSSITLEYDMEECFKALIDKLDWNIPEGDRCPFDLIEAFLLNGRPGRLIVAAEYFFNNDLEFLKSSNPEKKYITSITKTKETRYEIVRIEDMFPTLWSATKVGYNKDVEKGIKHWGEKRQLWYRSHMNKFSKHNVYSTQKILSMKRVMRVDELYKFLDGTLKTVRYELHHKILNFRLGYKKEMSRRKWTAIDKRRSKLMVELIDKQMRERQILRNLEIL